MLSFNPLSIPFFGAAALIAAMTVFVVLVDGNVPLRVALAVALVCSMPWALANGLLICARDPGLAIRLAKLYLSTMPLLGAAVLLTVLVLAGRLDRHRWLLAAAAAIAVASCAITWLTPEVVAGVWKTSWGIFAPRAGPLAEAVTWQFLLWGGLGFFLARAGRIRQRSERLRAQARRFSIVFALMVLGTPDLLLARGHGVYPVSIVPGTIALVTVAVALVRNDVLQSRGLDRTMAVELAMVAALAVGLYAAYLATAAPVAALGPGIRLAVVTGLLVAAEIAIQIVRGRARADRARRARGADRAVDEFVDRSGEVRDEAELAALVHALFEGALALSEGRLLVADEDGRLRPTGEDGAGIAVDARVRAWLVANRIPLVADTLSPTRIGGLWGPIHAFLDSLDADVVLALVDRDRLVGVITAKVPSRIRVAGFERLLEQVQAAAARSLTYVALLRDAEERVGMAQEVEVAAAVQQAHAPGAKELRLDLLEVKSYYRPSPTFGGDWSAAYALDDGRLLVAVGDVSGRGMPAALVSATVAGACETAQRVLGADLTAAGLLRVLNDCVLDVGMLRYAMSCFVALFDAGRREVVFSNAGHPFPYVCRRADAGSRAALTSLVLAGIPLGAEADPPFGEGRFSLRADDVVVFYSGALVEARSPGGAAYGERRLRRILRDRALPSGARVCDVVVEDLLAHYGKRGPQDDVTLVTVRLRGPAATPARRAPSSPS